VCSQNNHSKLKRLQIVLVNDNQPLLDLLVQQLRYNRKLYIAANFHTTPPTTGLDLIKKIQPHLLLFALSNTATHLPALITDWQKACPTLKMIITYPAAHGFDLSSFPHADTHISQNDINAELITAISATLQGQPYFSQQITQQIAHQALEVNTLSGLSKLSSKELSILLHMAQGNALSSIANTLNLSKKTIAFYRYHLFHKLHVIAKDNMAVT
jgi:DNA-binding NarL/FixJ family response regulator